MIKSALSKYKFVVIRGLNLKAPALEELGSKFGQFADDPYLESLENYEHVVEVKKGMRRRQPPFLEVIGIRIGVFKKTSGIYIPLC